MSDLLGANTASCFKFSFFVKMEEGKEERKKREQPKTCEGCDAMCCKYIAMEIDCPEDAEDFEDIKWYVCHKNVNVFVDQEKV